MKSKTSTIFKNTPFVIFTIIGLLLVNFVVFGYGKENLKRIIKFNLTDVDGNSWKSEDLNGSVVVFNFWFTACPPCKKEIPELNKLVEEYENMGVVFIGVSLNSADEVEDFICKYPFKYKLIPDGDGFIDEQQITSFPTQFIINRDGVLVKKIVGTVTYSEIKKIIDSVISK
jgi:peroxiredoxin